MQRPRFRFDYQPVRATPDVLLVVGEGRHLVLDGAVTGDVADLLDGSLTAGDVVARLIDVHPLPAVLTALRRLQGLGVLAEGRTAVAPGPAAGWDARGVDPDAAQAWLHGGRIAVLDLGAPAVAVLAATLRAAGPDVDVGTDPDAADPDALLVVAPASMIDPRLDELNARRLASGRAWVLVRPHGNVVTMGPHLVPGTTGCWQCLRQRWEANEQLESYLATELSDRGRISSARAALPGSAAAIGGLLATELAAIAVTGSSARITGQVVSLDTRDHTTGTHVLVRQPQCPGCGDPSILFKAGPRIALGSGQHRSIADDGGHRVNTPQETFDRLRHHVSPLLGAVTDLTPLDGQDNGVTYSYGAGHNFALGTKSLISVRKNLRGASGGKGRTEIQAKVSAVCEAIERYSGVWRGDRPVHAASFAQLGPERSLHPRDLLLFSDDQYADRDAFNARYGGSLSAVPRLLDDETVIDWSTAWSLTRDTPREVPAAYCWYGHPDLARHEFCFCDSNGCASGNTVEEAILQGFCELVERDAVAIWWYNRSAVPGVDLDRLGDPWVNRMREFYERDLRRTLWVLDVTADLPVPCYVAVSHRLDGAEIGGTAGGVEDPIVGFGAHLDPRVALHRAVTEANQFLPGLVNRNADGSTRYGIDDPDSLHWFTTARVSEQTWLRPNGWTTLDARGDTSSGDITTDVRRCVDIAADAGMEVVVLDQSRPELELPVVRVIVPGLRHFWRRLGPGRLYDVPAVLGRTPRAATGSDINPYSIFF